MTINDLFAEGVEIQGECCYCYYDYEKECRIEISEKAAKNHNIKYIYCENGKLYIEVEKEEN